ncbi:Photosystem II Pbs27 [Vigna unguiculata]|uniref:Photosystem II Pbs27 n=4 Tax=Vigna unguiculata TaxID=3917 RepID=A0A4D6N8R2_VIGUN|nr:Photosystem II Pbs27 [Vigna unguiculata]
MIPFDKSAKEIVSQDSGEIVVAAKHRRMAIILAANMCSITNSKTVEGIKRFANEDKVQSRSNIALPHLEASSSRRHLLVGVGPSLATLACGLSPSMVWAEESSGEKEEEDKGVIGAIKSLFDPNEKTKYGKVLPKAYLKSAREVVKTLRESLNETSDDVAKFRRTADSAKESIRKYLGSWRGNQTLVQEESYVILEKVIRSLANFYSKAGPSAPLSQEVKSEILDYLNTAEDFL